jgi:hypothetical protein
MSTIKPSEATQHFRKTVFVEGKIAGSKSYTSANGGRWVVRIADLDKSVGQYDAVLVVNKDPNLNPPVYALGVGAPNHAIIKLFEDVTFGALFQPGTTFRAEAVVGNYNGMVWFNVWQIFLSIPQFMIGTRQVYNEPYCERRLLLRARGILGRNINFRNTNFGGTFIGNFVHDIFQKIAVSSHRPELIAEFRENPKEFLLKSSQPMTILSGAMGSLGDSPRIKGNEWRVVKNQIERLIDSSSVQSLINHESNWFSEVPVSGGAIQGDIDLRSAARIIDLKTGVHSPHHDNQICVYLVGEIVEKGFACKDDVEAYLIYSSGTIKNDSLRVRKIAGNSSRVLESLERFLLARHRLLLVSAGKKLPKIDLDPITCREERCEYISQDDQHTCSCHFYCQTDRNWSCEGCKHTPLCTEHTKRHSFGVIDEANRIRVALTREIEFQRRGADTYQSWSGRFEIVDIAPNRSIILRPLSLCELDPPSPGEKVRLKLENDHPTTAGVMMVSEDDNWVVNNRGNGSFEKGSFLQLVQPRSELNGIYHLLGCVDYLQRLGDVSHLQGISFAGGSIAFGAPEIVDDFRSVLLDNTVTDIFCQSHGVIKSKHLLMDLINLVSGRILVVSDAEIPAISGSIDLRCVQMSDLLSGTRSIEDGINRVKDRLFQSRCWIISPDILLNTDICSALPNLGREFFDHAVIFETNSVTGLEYFLIRKFGKHMITIGDANCVGRPLHSQQSKLMGLGDNLMARVYGRGFPSVNGQIIPKLVCEREQPIDPELNRSLDSCRLIPAENCMSKLDIKLVPCKPDSTITERRLIFSCETAAVDGGPPKILRLSIENTPSSEEIESDLGELVCQISNSLVEDDILTSPTSGRSYRVIQAPSNRDDEGSEWMVNIFAIVDQRNISMSEVIEVIERSKKLIQLGVNPKNLAILSASHDQLALVAQSLGDELIGVALRTPYGIRGESWGNVIITCAVGSSQALDTRELYTMLRSSITRAFIVGSPSILENHPLLRTIH